MTKQEQIKEMARTRCGYCDKEGRCIANNGVLYDAGYRKTFTSDLTSDTQKAFKEGYQKGKADTLERVAKYLDAQRRYFGLGYRIKQHLSEIDELLKEYEVEE